MRQRQEVTENEKELLNAIGRNPDISLKELVNCTQYKWQSTIMRKVNQLRERNILMGPFFRADYGKVCRNPLYRVVCVIELGQSYETVVGYLKLIEPLVTVYPVLSSLKELLWVAFLSSNGEEVKALLQLLKETNIITDYFALVNQNKTVIDNPNFFGDLVPALDTLFDPCEVPDISYGHHDTEWSECDIRVLSYLHGGYESLKLIEILKKERQLHRDWTYEQIKYSFDKICKNGLIWKIYFIHPIPLEHCADFFLFLKTDDLALTRRIMCNFARGGRIQREYTLCEDWGLMGFVCDPRFLLDLMHKLDRVEEIREKDLYHLRSFTPGIQYVGERSEFTYFDVETQTLEYPYHMFRERIKEKIEGESV